MSAKAGRIRSATRGSGKLPEIAPKLSVIETLTETKRAQQPETKLASAQNVHVMLNQNSGNARADEAEELAECRRNLSVSAPGSEVNVLDSAVQLEERDRYLKSVQRNYENLASLCASSSTRCIRCCAHAAHTLSSTLLRNDCGVEHAENQL